MSVHRAIAAAEAVLPGTVDAVDENGLDPRWQAIIAVGKHVQTDPEPVWLFAQRWGASRDEDLRSAVATCLLEHLMEHYFEQFFPRINAAADSDPYFANCVSRCWAMGQAAEAPNLSKFESLKSRASAV